MFLFANAYLSYREAVQVPNFFLQLLKIYWKNLNRLTEFDKKEIIYCVSSKWHWKKTMTLKLLSKFKTGFYKNYTTIKKASIKEKVAKFSLN